MGRTAHLAVLFSLLVACAAVPDPTSAAKPTLIYRAANTRQREVALTFDDGPSPYTAAVLSTLRRFHIHATFFVVGANAASLPGLLRQEIRDGDRIGNHTYLHSDCVLLSTPVIEQQLRATQRIVHGATGFTPHWFRPPYGAIDVRVALVAKSLGLRSITWSVDPRDWSLPGTAWIESQVLTNTHPGSVVLMHDGGGNRSETVAALPTIISTLKARGYRFVSLHQLFFPTHSTHQKRGTRPAHQHRGTRPLRPS